MFESHYTSKLEVSDCLYSLDSLVCDLANKCVLLATRLRRRREKKKGSTHDLINLCVFSDTWM